MSIAWNSCQLKETEDFHIAFMRIHHFYVYLQDSISPQKA